MEMNEKIKLLRKRYALTLEEVGNLVGVGKSTVRKWESGDIANMRRDKIAKLAKALNTTPAYLMGWDSDDSINDSNRVSEECEPYSVLSCAIPVSDDENELLCAYRSATEKGRNMAMGILISNQEEEVFRSQKQA